MGAQAELEVQDDLQAGAPARKPILGHLRPQPLELAREEGGERRAAPLPAAAEGGGVVVAEADGPAPAYPPHGLAVAAHSPGAAGRARILHQDLPLEVEDPGPARRADPEPKVGAGQAPGAGRGRGGRGSREPEGEARPPGEVEGHEEPREPGGAPLGGGTGGGLLPGDGQLHGPREGSAPGEVRTGPGEAGRAEQARHHERRVGELPLVRVLRVQQAEGAPQLPGPQAEARRGRERRQVRLGDLGARPREEEEDVGARAAARGRLDRHLHALEERPDVARGRDQRGIPR